VQSLVAQFASSGATPSSNAGELVQQALHKTLADMQELADTAYKTQSDSFAVVSKRVSEHVEELKALLQLKKP
jgi:phasin family protein